VIEIESPEIVLIGFTLAAMLTDDHARHGLEHLARPHDRPRIELGGRHRALTCSRCDSDEVLSRVVDVRDVSERARAGDNDIGIQGERQDGIGHRTAHRNNVQRSARHAEVEQAKRDLRRAGRYVVELIPPFVICGRRKLGSPNDQVNGDARQN